jgi:hypothetical protein
MGVAYEADLALSEIPGGSNADFAADLDAARALNAVVSNNSWSSSCGGVTTIASDVDTFIANNPSLSTTAAVAARISGCGSENSTLTSNMQLYVDAMDAFQSNGGIIIFAAGNNDSQTDVSAMSALSVWFPSAKRSITGSCIYGS